MRIDPKQYASSMAPRMVDGKNIVAGTLAYTFTTNGDRFVPVGSSQMLVQFTNVSSETPAGVNELHTLKSRVAKDTLLYDNAIKTHNLSLPPTFRGKGRTLHIKKNTLQISAGRDLHRSRVNVAKGNTAKTHAGYGTPTLPTLVYGYDYRVGDNSRWISPEDSGTPHWISYEPVEGLAVAQYYEDFEHLYGRTLRKPPRRFYSLLNPTKQLASKNNICGQHLTRLLKKSINPDTMSEQESAELSEMLTVLEPALYNWCEVAGFTDPTDEKNLDILLRWYQPVDLHLRTLTPDALVSHARKCYSYDPAVSRVLGFNDIRSVFVNRKSVFSVSRLPQITVLPVDTSKEPKDRFLFSLGNTTVSPLKKVQHEEVRCFA